MRMPFVFQSEATAKRALMEVPVEYVTPSESLPRQKAPARLALSKQAPSTLRTPQVFTESEVPVSRDTIPPQTKGHDLPPKYPNQLRAANIEGQVLARFTVRENGTVDSNSIVILKADHPLFANAVRGALETSHFSPATIKGRPVDWVMTMPFIFSLSK